MMREEMAGKSAPTMEANKEVVRPQAVEKPKEEASRPTAMAPAMKPKEETMPKEAAKSVENPFDLAGSRIQFAFDDYSLSSKSEDRLNRVATWLKKNSDTRIQIQGYTCDIGTDEYNLALGNKRAESARKYSRKNGSGLEQTFQNQLWKRKAQAP